MAIIKKGEEKGIPQKLQEILTAAFSFQAVRDAYKKAYEDKTADIKAYFDKNDDGFDVSTGKGAGFKCDEGQVQIKQLREFETDADKIAALIASKTITIDSLLKAVTFKQTELEKVLGPHYAECVKVADKPGISITLVGSAEWKATAKEKIGDLSGGKSESAPVEKAAPVVEPKAKKPSKAAAIAAKSKKTAKNADDDIDSILKE